MNFNFKNGLKQLTQTFAAFGDKHTTFVDKAFEELDGVNRFLGGETPPAQKTIAREAHAIIDAYIDRPTKDKEALKALLVLSLNTFLFDDTSRFAQRYSKAFSEMVDELVEGRLTENIAQIGMALSAAIAKNTLHDLQDPAKTQEILDELSKSSDDINAAISEQQEQLRQPAFASAPRLAAHVIELITELQQKTKSLLQTQKPPAPQPKTP